MHRKGVSIIEKGHKFTLGAVALSTVIILVGLAGVVTQKQKFEPVPYPVVVTATPVITASVSATPTLTPRTLLRSVSPTPKVVKPVGVVR